MQELIMRIIEFAAGGILIALGIYRIISKKAGFITDKTKYSPIDLKEYAPKEGVSNILLGIGIGVLGLNGLVDLKVVSISLIGDVFIVIGAVLLIFWSSMYLKKKM